MAQNQNNPFIYLTVPYRYNCVYQKLLRKLADLGIDILNDCGATCRGINRNIINCWNMFQAACGAYALGEGKKADLLINYINIQLKFGCPLLDEETEPPVIKIPAIKTFDIPDVRNSYVGVVNITNITLVFENPELFKENSLRIGASYEGARIDTVLAENLPIADNPILNDVTFELKSDRNYFVAEAIVDADNTVVIASFDIIPLSNTRRFYYGIPPYDSSLSNANASLIKNWTWDLPNSTTSIYIAYPKYSRISSIINNSGTNLYEEIKNSHGVNISGITIGGNDYVIETLTYFPGFDNSLQIRMV
jgi:hypothetical protein